MARKLTLTAAAIEKMKAPASGRIDVWDTRSPQGGSFGLRIAASGRKTFVLLTRLNGTSKRYSLGSFPQTSLAEARRMALEVLEQRDRGEVPTHAGAREQTFGDVARAFIRRGLVVSTKGARTGRPLKRGLEIERIIERELMPSWQGRAWSSLRKRDAYDLFDDLIDGGRPQAANKLHETIRRISRWASRRDMIDANPFADMDTPAARVERARYLSHDEIREVWKTATLMGYPAGPFFKLAILTGQRKSEVAGMRREELDLEAKTWTIPGTRTKNGVPMTVYLSAPALDVIESLPRFTGPYMFTTTAGQRPISGFSKIKARADDLSGVTGWTIHDLRRTARTLLAEVGTRQEVGERALNHQSRNALVRTYDKFNYAKPLRIAFKKLGNHVAEIVAPKKPGKVVHLRKAA